MAETNGPPAEKPVEGKPREAAQPSIDSKPAEATENSAASTITRPLARELYDWASRLTAEAGGPEEYYWTPEIERLVTKLKMSKRALVGVVGVQGAGKSATMRAITDRLKLEFPDSTVAVKVPESGGLRGALNDAVGDVLTKRLDGLLNAEVLDRVQKDSAFYQRAIQLAKRMERTGLEERLHLLDPESGISVDTTDFYLPPSLHLLVSKPRIRELEERALDQLLSERRVIMIDMPDYPKHDRRLIVRDLDDIQGLWNRSMTSDKDVSLVIFIQKETFNYADHFFYGKMEIVDLASLITGQLMDAYMRKWKDYAPFKVEALEYLAEMSRGIFRRFKRYIGLVLGVWIPERAGDAGLIDLAFAKTCVTEDELMRDLRKDLEGIFKNREQSERAARILKIISDQKEGISQSAAAEKLELNEMAVSRIAKELEEHGYIKRTTRYGHTLVFDKKLDEHVEVPLVEKIMEIIQE